MRRTRNPYRLNQKQIVLLSCLQYAADGHAPSTCTALSVEVAREAEDHGLIERDPWRLTALGCIRLDELDEQSHLAKMAS